MSVAFSSARPRSKGEVTQQTIQKMLDENHHLIQCIMDYQSKGKTAECTQYQQILHRNLVYLATIADSNQNMQSLLPAPPTPNMSMGPAGMGQSGGHAPSNLNDNMAPGLPPTSMMQSQMSNVSMMHQQSATPHYSSAQAGGQHYQGQQAMGMMGQGSQGNNMMSQRPMGSYRSTQQGSAQQYMGQDEFYGEQYGHTQSSSEPINRQYYPDGHGEYSYQQSSYGEQGYDRSFDESSQHYYEGGNSQYSQQQAQYQQGSGQQQPFSQQQYSSQQGYSAQPQGYAGPGQGGSSQYSQYQQGQSQQYGSYRSSQGGPGAQTQRPYAYEQGQYGNYQQ
ncbi:calcium-responsive transactivator-like isoform X4 [Epinephelus lanceolatus]|uniref:calcium-responsive transactivator-like isoform X4 n=1 Tax=Epinephelus lanceolatus TaxID=310571 RepID=UPI001446BA8E|nr:calcium-responsive transactivator-like isoform X4 [Epinephelus lanceolatus]